MARSESDPGIRIQEAHPKGTSARWCLDRYFEELEDLFEGGFDLSKSAVADTSEFLPPGGVFLVATLEGRPVGCGGLKLTGDGAGYIKRMWIDSSLRGHGLGRRMLEALESAAAGLGCRVVQLETNRALTAAKQLYRTSGYREVPPFNDEYYAHHWFEKALPQDPQAEG